MNLLPEDWSHRLLIRQRVRLWIGIWILASCACLTVASANYAMQVKHRTDIQGIREAARPVQQVAREVHQLRARLAILEGRETLLATLESASHPFLMLGIVQESADTDIGHVRVTGFEITTRSLTNPNPKKVKRTSKADALAKEVELAVTGTASDDFAITQFVSHLKGFEVFDQVVLHSSQSMGDNAERTFRIGCTFKK